MVSKYTKEGGLEVIKEVQNIYNISIYSLGFKYFSYCKYKNLKSA